MGTARVISAARVTRCHMGRFGASALERGSDAGSCESGGCGERRLVGDCAGVGCVRRSTGAARGATAVGVPSVGVTSGGVTWVGVTWVGVISGGVTSLGGTSLGAASSEAGAATGTAIARGGIGVSSSTSCAVGSGGRDTGFLGVLAGDRRFFESPSLLLRRRRLFLRPTVKKPPRAGRIPKTARQLALVVRFGPRSDS